MGEEDAAAESVELDRRGGLGLDVDLVRRVRGRRGPGLPFGGERTVSLSRARRRGERTWRTLPASARVIVSFSLSFFPLPAPLDARSARAMVTLLRGESFEVEAEGVEEKARAGAATLAAARAARLNRDILAVSRGEGGGVNGASEPNV